jgi:uncharacterized damage-inducible protein DinB
MGRCVIAAEREPSLTCSTAAGTHAKRLDARRQLAACHLWPVPRGAQYVRVANAHATRCRLLGGPMPRTSPAQPVVLADALLDAYRTNDQITRYLIENLSDEAWSAPPPGGKGRPIAAITAHMHNVRVMWLKATAKGSDISIPGQLDRHTVTRAEALDALAESYAAIARVLAASLSGDGRVKGFRPDVAGFVGYLISHDAHHRGQITMLARMLGYPVEQKVMFGMWEWGTRARTV